MALIGALAGCAESTSGGTGGGAAPAPGTPAPGAAAGDSDAATPTPAEPEPKTCDPSACDDGNPCTVDACGADAECTHQPNATNECRPQIEVDYPARGATITGQGDAMRITVTGSVRSGLGDIAELTMNGVAVDVAADGSFSAPLDVRVGGNTLVLGVSDSTGATRSRVQSFLWGTEYRLPTVALEGAAPAALGIWFGPQSLDDGNNGQPLNDLASIFNTAIGGLDPSSLLGSSGPIAEEAGFAIHLGSLALGGSSVRLQPIDGGLHLSATINDVTGQLDFRCGNFICFLAGGSSSGGLALSRVSIDADLLIRVNEARQLVVEVANISTGLGDLDIWSNNWWTDFLVGILEPILLQGVIPDLQGKLSDSLRGLLGPLVQSGLGSLALTFDLDLPSLGNPDGSIPVSLVTGFDAVDFRKGAGGAFVESAGAYTPTTVSPWDNDGIPLRNNCGQGEQRMELPKEAPFELGLSDDLINQILFAAWGGGLLHFPVGAEVLGDAAALDGLGITELDLFASGMLAPTVSDCNDDGSLMFHLGDLRIDGSLRVRGEPVSFVSFTSLQAPMDLGADDTGLTLGIRGVEVVHTQLDVNEDEMLALEPLIKGILEDALVGVVESALGEGGLGGLPLPQFDVSSSLGLPPGTAAIDIKVGGTSRQGGLTVLSGTL